MEWARGTGARQVLAAIACGAWLLAGVAVASQKKPKVVTTEELWPTNPQVHQLVKDEMADGRPREGFVPPAKIGHVQPKYPKDAIRYGISGVVVIQARIDARNGEPRDVQALQAPVVLAEAAMSAVKRWRYRPLMIDRMKHELTSLISGT